MKRRQFLSQFGAVSGALLGAQQIELDPEIWNYILEDLPGNRLIPYLSHNETERVQEEDLEIFVFDGQALQKFYSELTNSAARGEFGANPAFSPELKESEATQHTLVLMVKKKDALVASRGAKILISDEIDLEKWPIPNNGDIPIKYDTQFTSYFESLPREQRIMYLGGHSSSLPSNLYIPLFLAFETYAIKTLGPDKIWVTADELSLPIIQQQSMDLKGTLEVVGYESFELYERALHPNESFIQS